ncbi:uncharacterized protein PV09_01426 [Verruconis gallopava]|uniref:BAH domain-containing protein n=1 Tax=Verruconis gallopava TaxID=253628 RepID=A0A0D2B8C3_9PEZI|nr:uncharacterized protein PV09_01426 [Verruconis gallopava]KIW07454.1 hypothetical protein PV09_01426 [Verruconis gallopava]
MLEALKKTVPSALKRKADGLNSTPSSSKKSKSLHSPRPSSEPVSDIPSFEANVVPYNYKPKPDEVLKSFDDIAAGQSLVYQAEGFFKAASRVCIKNGHDWDALTRYKKAVYMGTKFCVGDDVLIMQDETADDNSALAPELKGRWVGRIIEIRAINQENVFILINWYNRPEDLPKGRQPHHGMNEILATNDVDIISPTALVGKIDVDYWIESDDTAPRDHTIFWRQCVAMEDRSKPRFSKLNAVCVCKQPANVDKMLLECGSCALWMHDECFIKALAKRHGVADKSWKRLIVAGEDGTIPDILPNKFKLSPPKGKPWTVEIQNEEGMFVSNDKADCLWEEKILCLSCSNWLR